MQKGSAVSDLTFLVLLDSVKSVGELVLLGMVKTELLQRSRRLLEWAGA